MGTRYYVARLWEKADGRIRCLVCERKCTLSVGQMGFCGNYQNIDGKLVHAGYGLVSAVESRPIEIKPFFHYWPGSSALTFSLWSCNFLCPWCQNWSLSKRKPKPGSDEYIPPEKLVELALRAGDEGLCASFNEPTIGFDYLVDVFELGRKHGLYGTIVTNGYMTLKALKLLLEVGVDGYSIDIKGCPETYRRYIGTINGAEVVLRNAKYILDNGGHVEMVFLVVPGANDSNECIEWVLGKLYDNLGPDTPLHINRYYPAYKYSKPPTPISTLLRVYDKAKKMGFNYVYIGNIGAGTPYENTYCPKCGKTLIVRYGTEIVEYNITSDGKCPRCGHRILIRGKPILKHSTRWRSWI